MVNRYNFYNLEASFKQFLLAGNNNPTSIKNYLSDLRHFFGWLTFYLESHQLNDIKVSFNDEVLRDYKSYLLENKIPRLTINRRLSTLRKFGSFCLAQGWLNDNPAKKIHNLEAVSQNENNKLWLSFSKDILVDASTQSEVDILHDDIRDFLAIINPKN